MSVSFETSAGGEKAGFSSGSAVTPLGVTEPTREKPLNASPGASAKALPGAPSAEDVLVRVEGASKKFCRNMRKSLAYGLRDVLAELNPFGRRSPAGGGSSGLRPGEFWAIKDVSFELRRGECLGIIGHNGAGKTTLLKMLNGLIKPDEGRIEMRGRVGALIALGAGFNQILTGRENIYVNGSILGLKKREIDAKIDEIIEFSGIGEFIDSPVQSYSSGMQVRLGFSVAVNLLRPDVLILDEVLAVGDLSFRLKCLNKVAQISANCATIFISHEPLQVSRICHRVIWLDKGRLIRDTRNVDATLADYSASLSAANATRIGDVTAVGRVSDLRINGRPWSPNSREFLDLPAGEPLTVSLVLDPIASAARPYARMYLLTEAGHGVAEFRGEGPAELFHLPDSCASQPVELTLSLGRVPLADGIYVVRMVVGEKNSINWLVMIPFLFTMRVTGNGHAWCKTFIPTQYRIEPVSSGEG